MLVVLPLVVLVVEPSFWFLTLFVIGIESILFVKLFSGRWLSKRTAFYWVVVNLLVATTTFFISSLVNTDYLCVLTPIPNIGEASEGGVLQFPNLFYYLISFGIILFLKVLYARIFKRFENKSSDLIIAALFSSLLSFIIFFIYFRFLFSTIIPAPFGF